MNIKKKHYYFIILIILFISIGFAYLSANLDIMGIANVRKMKWNIYFDNIKNYEHEECFNEKPTTTGTTTTSLNFKVSLEDPGDSCSFNVDVINDGTIDAMVSLLQKTNLDEAQSKLLDFNITYADGSPIENKNFLGSGESETLKVSLTFNRNIEIEDLPTADTEINVTIDLQYQQAKDSDKRQNSNTAIIKDLSGNANHGKIVRATINEDGTVSTNGTSSYVFCGLKNYEFPNGLSYVVRFTFLKESNGSIFGNADAGGTDLEIHGGKLLARTYADGQYVDAVSSTDMTVDNIFHTAVVVTTDKKTTLYLDGASSGEATYYKSTLNTPVSFALGANMDYSDDKVSSFISVKVSDVLLFERELTVDEITTDYSNVVTPSNKNGLILYYQFKK